MLKARTSNQRLSQTNLVQKNYRVGYQGKEGHLLLLKNIIQVIVESDNTPTGYTSVFELPYEHIMGITVQTWYRLILVDRESRTHSLISPPNLTAYRIEADLKSRIAPLDYHQFG